MEKRYNIGLFMVVVWGFLFSPMCQAAQEGVLAVQGSAVTGLLAENEPRAQAVGFGGHDEDRKEAAAEMNKTHLVSICIDNTEIHRPDSHRAFTLAQAIPILQQQVGPLVISGSLLSLIFNYRNGNLPGEIKVLVKLFVDRFDSRQWIIRQLSDDLYVLVPKKCLIGDDSVENSIGINWRSMQAIKDIEENKKSDAIQAYFIAKHDEFKEKAVQDICEGTGVLGQQLLHALEHNTLFVPGTHHRYAIYCTGHGNYNKHVAGICLHPEEGQQDSAFQQLLGYLKTKINTKIFMYNSCFAAGLAHQLIYGDVQAAGGVRTYPFAIVTGATTDAIVYLNKFNFKKSADGSLDTELRFDHFVQAVQADELNYTEALGHIFPLVKRAVDVQLPQEVASMPLLRAPEAPVFKPVYDKSCGNVITISKIMAATRKKPLVIDNSVKSILLETTEIPFPVIIDATVSTMPLFISMLSGETVIHSFKSIIVENLSFDVPVFIKSIDYGNDLIIKKFIIEKLIDNKGELEDVVIDISGYSQYSQAYALKKLNGRKLVVNMIDPNRPNYLNEQQYRDILSTYHRHCITDIKETNTKKITLAVEKIAEIKRFADVRLQLESQDNDRIVQDRIRLIKKVSIQQEPKKEFFSTCTSKAKNFFARTEDVDNELRKATYWGNMEAVKILLDASRVQKMLLVF
ncbi:MAG: hypothetical protein NT124_03515 [Candidatus Dependentiae bacterium]|nr:hypothetical protein [Candidatus Dependentiae bacterium]